MNGSNILEILETGTYKVFYPENVGREGLFINLQAFFVAWLGNNAFALRVPAALIGTLTVWGVYLLGVELFSVPTGLWGAFFLATSFWHLLFSRTGLRAICGPLFLVWSLYLLLVGLRRAREDKSSTAAMAVAGVVYGLGFHTYISYRLTPVLVLGVLLWAGKSLWKKSLPFVVSAAIVAAPLAWYFLNHPDQFSNRAGQVSVWRTDHPYSELVTNVWKTGLMFFMEGDRNWRHNYGGRPELFWPVGILFAIGIALAFVAFCKRERFFPYALLTAMIVVAAIPAVLTDDGVPHALRSLMMVPAVVLLAGYAAEWAYGHAPKSVGIAAALILGVLCIQHAFHTYFDLWANDSHLPPNYCASIVKLAEQYNAIPPQDRGYIAVTSTGPSANGIPVMFQPFVYLTHSYTARQQQETNIHYVTPETYRPTAPGSSFCQQVQGSMPGVRVACVNLRF